MFGNLLNEVFEIKPLLFNFQFYASVISKYAGLTFVCMRSSSDLMLYCDDIHFVHILLRARCTQSVARQAAYRQHYRLHLHSSVNSNQGRVFFWAQCPRVGDRVYFHRQRAMMCTKQNAALTKDSIQLQGQCVVLDYIN